MKISYDKKVNSLNIFLRAGTVAKTVEISPEVLVDLDKTGNALYLEIININSFGSFDFLKREPEIYTVDDLKKRYA